MSTNNFIAIIEEEDGTFTGYDCSASQWYPTLASYRQRGIQVFDNKTKPEAIQYCQYKDNPGYRFVNLKDEVGERKTVSIQPEWLIEWEKNKVTS